ncbi:MAG: alpha/beta hydrolase [Candidatus Omnitrophica bacterium]|nr:alpha/beta hydrolase [Candidatus Omnitrophota bacterium]
MKTIELTPKDIGLEYEDVYFETKDGIKLNGWLVPKNDSAAYLLFCHGNAGNISHRLEMIDIFIKIGLNVFIFDYRGYGRSQGIPSEGGIYQDVRAAYNYLISKGINEKNIVVFGESLGGAAAVDLAKDLERGALITEGLFTSVPNMAGEIYPCLPIKFVISSRYDNISKIKNIKIPKLIIHSKDDEIIPYHHGERLFKSAKPPKDFFQLRGGHTDGVLLMRDEFSRAIENFLKKYGIPLKI